MQIIDESAFRGCDGLETVVLSDGVKTIEMDAFGYCESLKEITIPGSVEYVSEWVFESSLNIERINFGGTMAAWESFEVYIGSECVVSCSDGVINYNN